MDENESSARTGRLSGPRLNMFVMQITSFSMRCGNSAGLALAVGLLIPQLAQAAADMAEASTADPVSAPSAPAPPRSRNVDALRLVGTASSPTSEYAFFDSNRPEFRLLVHRGDKIGNCVVESILADCVRLKDGAQEIVLPVSQQVQREDRGTWQLAAVEKRMDWADESPSPIPSPLPSAPASKPVKMVAAVAPIAPAIPEISDKQLRKLDKVAVEGGKPMKGMKDLGRAVESRVIKSIAKEFKRAK